MIDFKDILDHLRKGHEIEFAYKGKRYSITDLHGYWEFCLDTDNEIIEIICPFDDKDTLIEEVSAYSIDGVLLSTIFDEKQYDASSICIL